VSGGDNGRYGEGKADEQLGDYTPINGLTTFNYEWKIKAKVTKKNTVRTWNNKTSNGRLFNIELTDAQGT
jgi:ssDNA-binding replication factor A large subunit